MPTEEREQFRKIADKMLLAVLELDVDLNLTYANPRALEILGMDPKEIDAGISVLELVAPEQVTVVRAGFKALTKGLAPTSLSVRARRRDDIRVPVEVYSQRIFENDKHVGFIVYAVDMSRRRVIEEKFDEEEEFLRATIEHSQAGILVVGSDYRLEYINDRLCDILGRTHGELLGRDFRTFLHPDSVELVADRYIKRQKGIRVPSTYEFKILRSDGSIRHVQIASTVIKGSNGTVKTVAQILDITEEKESKRALEASERRYRSLVETMADGLGIDDENEVITYVNNALCEMLGYSRDELIGLRDADLFFDFDREKLDKKMMARKEGIFEQYEAQLIKKTGELLPVIVSAAPLPSPDNRYIGSFALFTDVSALKNAEAEARFLLDLLLHDIGNQLQLIIAGADLWNKESSLDIIESAQAYIRDGAQRCIDLIMKIRGAEESKVEPLHPVDLIDVVEGEAHLLATQLGVEPECIDLPESMFVYADSALDHLIWNLLENAVKHNPNEERHVWVTGEGKGGVFELSIADNGCGLSDSEKKQIFNTGRRFGGVGLHLVRRLVNKYGIQLYVEDRIENQPDKGLKVIVPFRIAYQTQTDHN
jgi:PAS domain S-box-containing protein